MRFNVIRESNTNNRLFKPCEGAKYDREEEAWYIELGSLNELLMWVDDMGCDVSILPLDEDDEHYYLIINDRSW